MQKTVFSVFANWQMFVIVLVEDIIEPFHEQGKLSLHQIHVDISNLNRRCHRNQHDQSPQRFEDIV